MSLTSQIAKSDSTFMQFARSAIPNSKAITADKRGRHCGAIDVAVDPASHRKPDWALIGAAIDCRLRLAFSRKQPMPPSARRGFRWLSRQVTTGSLTLLTDLEKELQQLLSDKTDATDHPVELPVAADEDRLLRLCVVAAWLDQLHRAGPFILDRSPLINSERAIRPLDDLAASVPQFVVEQLQEQVAIANDGLAPLQSPTPTTVALGPRFDGADRIGGADADVIVDGTLIDFKSSRGATTIGRADVYQLAGYALFDFDNEYEITSLGVYWTRHRISRIFNVEEYFELLGATQPIAELRKMLQSSLGKGRPKLRPEDRLAYIESLRPLAEDHNRRRAARRG